MKNSLVFLAIAVTMLIVPAITKAESPIMCTMQYDPVCGTEKGVYKTYGNGCVLSSEGATYQHQGECTAAELEGRQEGTYTPPAHCTAWSDGCNWCSRSANGQSMCTLMACMGEPRAGYCTAYGETETEEETPKPPSTSVSSDPVEPVPPVATIESEATTTMESDPGFFFSLWRTISSWFRGLF